MAEVRPERTGWRDEGLSRRHRAWGYDCPFLDLDFVAVEFDRAKPAALVEYKNEHATPQNSKHPSYQALIDLGTNHNPPLPVFAVRYASDFSWWRVTPLNGEARRWLPSVSDMTERDWVSLLYEIRGYRMPPDLFEEAGVEI